MKTSEKFGVFPQFSNSSAAEGKAKGLGPYATPGVGGGGCAVSSFLLVSRPSSNAISVFK